MRRGGFAALILVLLVAASWFLDSAVVPENAPGGDISKEERTGSLVPRWLAADTSGDEIFLSWRSVTGTLAYTLWRSPGPEGEAEVVYRGRDTTFVDRGGLDPEKNYCYQLTATDPEFDDSGFSEQMCPGTLDLSGGHNTGKKSGFEVK